MNKIIIVTSLMAISTPSLAKTKIYGELHASYDRIFSVGASSRDKFSLNNSIIGIKGSNELKKDISVIYQISWGVSSAAYDDINNSGFNNRNQVIGLASPSGALVVGRFDTPFKTVGRKADLFWHSQLGQNRNLTNARNWDVRADKIIAFQSPIIKGFQTSVAYASDIADTSRVTQNATAISLNGFYKKGKFLLGAGFEQHDLDNLSANTKALRFTAAYKDGPYKVVGFYQKEDNDFASTTEPDAQVLGLGVAYKKGKGTFKAQFYNRDQDISDQSSNLIAIGYDYKLSKQLNMYVQTTKITNAENLSGFDLDISNTNSTTDAHGYSVGVRYKF